MTNAPRGEVELALGKEKLVLRPTFQAHTEIETLTGKALLEHLESFTPRRSTLKSTDAAVIIWAGARAADENESRSVEDFGELIAEHGLVTVLPACEMFVVTCVLGTREMIEEADQSPSPETAPGSPPPAPTGDG